MSQCLNLLDQALDLGRRELETFESGDTETLHECSAERARLIEEACGLREAAGESVDVDELLDKLRQLKAMQTTLSAKARKLHDSLTDDLMRMKREGRRLAGYGKASKITPLFGRRFIRRRG